MVIVAVMIVLTISQESGGQKTKPMCHKVTSSNTTQPTSSSVTPTVEQPSILTSEWPNTLSYNLTFIDQQKSWVEALRYCQDNHKTLVHILNPTVQKHVAQMLKDKIYPNGVWIGLERNMIVPWAPWLWTGGPYVNYSSWNSNFPVDPICQYCGKLVGNGTEWVDAYCSEELPFICQG
ncbi:lithostathine-1-beta [Astyanax mexicanus]|uniref:lithostathine-1-beta n=1 Tax=Astyanax mexicanus TaxID=7994 RepID=UPI0020CB473E|nr:lithostathine-1-beta [Astyanax mexicanus]